MNKIFFYIMAILYLGKYTTANQCLVENCNNCRLENNKCTQCQPQYFLGSDGYSCNRCSINCEQCDEKRCLKCHSQYILDESNTQNCLAQQQSQLNQYDRQLIIVEALKTGCHYSCETCIQKDSESFCISCPNTRYLDKFRGLEYGSCICNQSSLFDVGESECQEKNSKSIKEYHKDQIINQNHLLTTFRLIKKLVVGIDSFNIFSYMIQGLFLPAVVLTSIFGANASFLFMLIETAQSYNMFLYINSHNSGNMDSFLESFKFSHLDKYFPPITNQVYKIVWQQQPIINNPKILYDPYNSDNTLTNNWQYFTIMILLCSASLILNKVQPSFSSNEQQIIRWRKYLTFSLPFIYFYITFQSVFMQIIYTFSCFNDTNHLGKAGLAFSFLQFFYLIGVGFALCFIYTKQIHTQKYYFVEHVLENDRLSKRIFLTWQFIKKIIVATVVVGMYKSPTGQAIILFLLQVINITYIYIFHPIQKQNKPTRKKIGIIHQIIIILVHLFFIIKQTVSVNFGFDMFIAIIMLLDLLLISIKGISISIRSIKKYALEQFSKLQNEDLPTQQNPPPPQLKDCQNISVSLTQQKQQSITVIFDKQEPVFNIDNSQFNHQLN